MNWRKTGCDEIDSIIKEIESTWFQDHKASYCKLNSDDLNSCFLMKWSDPQSEMFAAEYRFFGLNLVVTGDVGCAIYVWHEPVSIDDLTQINLQYFANICKASEYPKSFELLGLNSFVIPRRIIGHWVGIQMANEQRELLPDGLIC